MKMDEFGQILKKALEEKAPIGFTDSIMDKLVVEEQKQLVVSNTPILGKGFIITFLGFFAIVVVYISSFEGPFESKYSIGKYVDRLFTGINFQFNPSTKMLVLSLAAICVLLIADYIFRSRKMVQI